MVDEIALDARCTKGKRARKVFPPKQMQKQLQECISSLQKHPLQSFLFSRQKSALCKTNIAKQNLQRLYENTGLH